LQTFPAPSFGTDRFGTDRPPRAAPHRSRFARDTDRTHRGNATAFLKLLFPPDDMFSTLNPVRFLPTAPFGSAPFGTEGTSNPFSFHTGIVNVCYGDGAVKALSDGITIQVFAALVTRSGAESVTDE